MKKALSNPMSIVLLFFITVLIGSNICCTGKASNKEPQATAINESGSVVTPETSGTVQSLSESTFDESIKSGIVLVDFWATWCMPCKLQSPIIEKVSTEMVGKATVYKLDIDKSPGIADRYDVQSIPTMIIFKDGKAVGQFVGLTQKADIISAIEKTSK